MSMVRRFRAGRIPPVRKFSRLLGLTPESLQLLRSQGQSIADGPNSLETLI
jgi:hypothetical protein